MAALSTVCRSNVDPLVQFRLYGYLCRDIYIAIVDFDGDELAMRYGYKAMIDHARAIPLNFGKYYLHRHEIYDYDK